MSYDDGPSYPAEPKAKPKAKPTRSRSMDPGIKRVLWIYFALGMMFVAVASFTIYTGFGLSKQLRAIAEQPPTARELGNILPEAPPFGASFQGVMADRDKNQFVFRLSKADADVVHEGLTRIGWQPMSAGRDEGQDALATRRGGTLVMLFNVKFDPTSDGEVAMLLVYRQTRATDPLAEIPDRYLEDRVLAAWTNERAK